MDRRGADRSSAHRSRDTSLIVYATTQYAISLADRLRFCDKPIGYKGHARPTPYLGGAPVVAGFVIAVLQSRATCTTRLRSGVE